MMHAYGVVAVSCESREAMIMAHQSPKPSPIAPPSSVEPKPGTWASWIAWPSSCHTTSRSSASSTPPVPKVIWSFDGS